MTLYGFFDFNKILQNSAKGHRSDTYCSHGFQPVDDWQKDNRSAIGTAHIWR